MTTSYYQITTTDEPGYPSRFLCEKCFNIDHEYDRAIAVEHCEAEKVNEDEIGTFCTMCNDPLASADADVKVTALDIDAIIALKDGSSATNLR